MSEELTNAMAEMKEQEAISIAKDLIDKGEDPHKIFASCRAAMEIVGSRFEKGEYFLPELMMSGEILRQISELLKPLMKEDAKSGGDAGKVIIATVQGDIHDIGEDIVVLMLDVNGFDVLDLGIDVPPAKIIEAIKDFQPQVVGLSGFLTVAFDSMKETVEQIKAAGLRDNIKIMIGGGQIDDEIKNYAGADAYGSDAMAAVKLSKEWIGG
jgi:5-methyltetrahydrofolate--homocysteine methyltransferase